MRSGIRLTFVAMSAFLLVTVGTAHAQDLGIRRPGGASAEPEVSYGDKGVYGIVAGVVAAEDFKERLGGSVDNSLGFDVRAGYRWHPNFATELGFEWLNEFEGKKGGPSIEGWSLTANSKAFLSTGRFQPFGILGLGIYSAESSGAGSSLDETEFGVRVGGGFNLFLTQSIALNGEGAYNFATGDLDDLRYTSFTWGVLIVP